MSDIPIIELNNQNKIPGVGFGLWKVADESECVQAVQWALEAGYRHFDTAQVYGNEAYLGKALASADVPRDELFITTKIAITNFGAKRTPHSFADSLQNLQMDYVDLLLLHFPVTLLRDKAWQALEKIQSIGKAKSIGVSNYTIRHLEHLLKHTGITPVINQVELHVFLQQPELVDYCRNHQIVIEAYSPLAHGEGMDDPVLLSLAQKYNKSAGQIMLRWCAEQGTVPLPKSVHHERIQQNIDIFDFEFDAADNQSLAQLDRGMRTCWDPTLVP